MLIVSLGLLGCADQPTPTCTTAPAAYAAKLFELDRQESADGVCEGTLAARGAVDPVFGIATYYEQNAKGGRPNYERGSVAIRADEFVNLLGRAAELDVESSLPDAKPYAFGAFKAPVADSSHFCSVPELSPAHIVLEEVPAVPDDPDTEDDEALPAQPAVDIELVWSNVQIYLTPSLLGTQLSAELEDTRRRPDGERCVIRYRALALAPAVSCKKLLSDGETPDTNEDGSFKADESLCSPEADVSQGRFQGSGISPDVAYECDPETFYCVIQGDSIPALRASH
jgi:hypothetical protein